jgi:hypothetical protein
MARLCNPGHRDAFMSAADSKQAILPVHVWHLCIISVCCHINSMSSLGYPSQPLNAKTGVPRFNWPCTVQVLLFCKYHTSCGQPRFSFSRRYHLFVVDLQASKVISANIDTTLRRYSDIYRKMSCHAVNAATSFLSTVHNGLFPIKFQPEILVMCLYVVQWERSRLTVLAGKSK